MTPEATTPAEGSPAASLEDALRAALGSDERDERATAIREASTRADPEALVVLMGDHADSIGRNAAMDALTRGGARSLSALVRALRHPDPEVVMFAAGVLGKTRDRAAIPHLVGLLTHLDVNVVQQAIESLAQLRASSAVGALLATLDEDPWLRFAAVHALGEIGDPRAVGKLATLLGDEVARDAVIGALGKIGTAEALEHLAAVLRESPEPDAFMACLQAIGAALDRHPDLKLVGRSAWAGLRSPDAGDVHERLVQVLAAEAPLEGDDAVDVRRAAAAVIHALRLRHLYTALVVAGSDAGLRQSLEFYVLALGADIVPTLRLGLSASSASVRELACQSLGALGGDEDAPAIAARLGDEVPGVRMAALGALARLGNGKHAHRMLPLLMDGSEEVRRAAVDALTRLDAQVVTLLLLTARAQHATHLVPTLAVMAANPHPDQLGFVERCLGHEAPEVRAAAVRALAAQRGDVVARVARAVHDPDAAVRRAALEVIATSRSALARRILLQALDEGTDADVVRAVGALDDLAVVPPLVRHLAAPAVDVRLATVAALRRFASPTIVRHVAALATDPDAGVREEVARLLAASGDPSARAALERLSVDPAGAVAEIARGALAEAA
ncbi:MAG TPA: HEAT repeat domain-containing protein [Polyangia bacterium]|nr:HEAT repeat domain-containing protein [Polyangia bacterium]